MILVSSPRFSLQPVELIIESIANYFRGWEIVAEWLHNLEKTEATLKALLPSYNMKLAVHAPLSDLNIGSINEKARALAIAEIENCVRIAADLGVVHLTIHPGHLSPLTLEAPQLCNEFTKESIQKIASFGEEYSMQIAIENMPKMAITICQKPSEILELLRGTELKICFDVGHAYTAGQLDAFLEYKNLFTNVHLHDNDGKRDNHLALGEGAVDFKKVINKIKNTYNGDYVIETKTLEAGVKSAKIVEKLIE